MAALGCEAAARSTRRYHELRTNPSLLLFSAGDLAAASRYRVEGEPAKHLVLAEIQLTDWLSIPRSSSRDGAGNLFRC
jgi:hypothetical protein